MWCFIEVLQACSTEREANLGTSYVAALQATGDDCGESSNGAGGLFAAAATAAAPARHPAAAGSAKERQQPVQQ